MKSRRIQIALVMSLLAAAVPARAAEIDLLVQKLVEKNILTRVDAQEILGQIRAEQAASAPQAAAKPAPSWLEGLTQKGDLRLRYEGFEFENEDARDRERGRFRLRWGLEKVLNEEWKAGFRLASGSDAEATSTNQSFDDEFNLKDIQIDRAYGIYTPVKRFQEAFPAVSTVEIGAGKVANPYENWGTSLVWDSDVTPEGAYEKVHFKLADLGAAESGGKWELNTLLGQFVLNENSSGQDSSVFAYGFGTTVAPNKTQNAFLGFVYYDWQDYAQLVKSGSVLTTVNPGGNDFEVDEFRVVSFYVELNTPVPMPWGRTPLKLFANYIHNTEEGDGTVNAGNDDGYSAGLKLGSSKAEGEWEAKYQWFYLENNATPGNFSESDVGLGFANNRGHAVQAAYRLLDSLQVVGSFSLGERIDAAISPAITEDREVTRWQLDLIYSF